MANPIHCDWAGCELLADVMVSRLSDGETTAWCGAHYVGIAQAVVSAAEDVVLAPEPEPEPPEPAEPEPDEDTDEDADAKVAARLVRYAAAQAADDEAPISSDDEPGTLGAPGEAPSVAVAAEPGPESVGDIAPGPAPEPTGPTVIPKGTSASRRRHEARKRAKAQAAEAADQKEEP